MWIFYFFAALVLWQGVLSLCGGWRYLAYIRREMRSQRAPFTPLVSLIVPCRGLDQGLDANIAALFDQHYPAYEVVFVVEHPDDPARIVIEEVRGRFDESGDDGRSVSSRIIVAGRAQACGQKVHNLLVGVGATNPASEVLAFVDTDVRVRPDWLRSLVAPLADGKKGAATGYRWFLPVNDSFSSHLRAVWNASIASALGERGDRNFCWGGSTAIRRSTFERIDMMEKWRGALSDDFVLTRALQQATLPIYFVPQCLTVSFEECNFAQLIEFTTRQVKITRVYAPHLWKILLGSGMLFVGVFYGGLALALVRAARGLSYAGPLAVVVAIYALGMGKAYVRLRAVGLPLASYRPMLRRGAAAHLFCWPLAAALYLYNSLAAAVSRRITWRGITYELKSPTETIIISDVSTVNTGTAAPTRHA